MKFKPRERTDLMWEILVLSLNLGDTPIFMSACLPYRGPVSSTENTEAQC